MNYFYCKCHLKKAFFVIFFSTLSYYLHAQARLTATASSGSAYPVISAAGFGNENPDCIHTSFGPHVTQAFDSNLGKNVFVFHSHITDDNDRCINTDRVRMEIKGGGSSGEQTQGQTAYFRWKFKLDANFKGGSSFCHIFQIKAVGGDDGAPIITITPRASILEVIHDGGDESGSVDLGRLVSVNLAPFKGTWVEGYIKYVSSDNGSFEITLKRVSDGATLLSYKKTSGIDLWRTGASRNHPKWGVYRSKNSSGLRDEQVRFADFCISESSASQCPSGAASVAGETSARIAQPGVIQNPLPGANVINLSIEQDGPAKLALYDMEGREIALLFNGYLQKGTHSIPTNSKKLATGVYILTLTQNNKRVSRRFIAP